MKRKILILMACVACAATFFSSCDVLKQAQGTYNMINCKYDYRSISGLSVAGIDLSRRVSLSDAPKLLGLLTGGAASVPVAMTVNLNVHNPNDAVASLNGVDYILAIDGVDFTRGTVAEPFEVAAGGQGVLPLAMAFDAASLLRGETGNVALGVVQNILEMAGVGNGSGQQSQVSLRIRPSFSVSGTSIKSPAYIPITFALGK